VISANCKNGTDLDDWCTGGLIVYVKPGDVDNFVVRCILALLVKELNLAEISKP
jgi:hypothetical protein